MTTDYYKTTDLGLTASLTASGFIIAELHSSFVLVQLNAEVFFIQHLHFLYVGISQHGKPTSKSVI